MSSNFQKKSSQIFVTVFIGVIVISFMFSGPFSGSGTPDSIGTVGPHDIKMREFNGEVQRQSQFYAQFVKAGQPLTTRELKQYKIYDNAIKNLVFQKLALILADEAGMVVGNEAIKADIKEATYFKTNEKFDINKYKALLSYNKITPEDFERDTENKLMSTRLNSLISHTSLTTEFKKVLNSLYKDKRDAKIISLAHVQIRKSIKVSKNEIKKFLAQENNLKKVESIFKQRQKSLSQPEEVRTRHILIKESKDALARALKIRKQVTTKNFISLAKKHTEEAQGKTNGGDLKWVKKGQMVAEFEKALFSMKPGEISAPIKTNFGYHIIYVIKKKSAIQAKFAGHKSKLASELIQKEKDLKPLIAKVNKQIMAALKSNRGLKRLTKKYQLTVKDKVVINRLEGIGSTGDLSTEALIDIFSNNKSQGMEVKGARTVLYAVSPFSGQNNVDFDIKSMSNIMTQQSRKSMLDKLASKFEFKQNKFARIPN